MVGFVPHRGRHIEGKYKFQIRTLAGGGFGTYLSLSEWFFEIQNLPGGQSCKYRMTTLDLNASALPIKFSVSGPSDWTQFSDDVYVNDFYGTVHINSAGAAIGSKGYSKSNMRWYSGPAIDLVVDGVGWCTGFYAGLQYSVGNMVSVTSFEVPDPNKRPHAGGKFRGL